MASFTLAREKQPSRTSQNTAKPTLMQTLLSLSLFVLECSLSSSHSDIPCSFDRRYFGEEKKKAGNRDTSITEDVRLMKKEKKRKRKQVLRVDVLVVPVCACYCSLAGRCSFVLNMREIYRVWRILLVHSSSFASHFILQFSTTITCSSSLRGVFSSVNRCSVLLLWPDWNSPSKLQCIFAARRQWTLSLSFHLFVFPNREKSTPIPLGSSFSHYFSLWRLFWNDQKNSNGHRHTHSSCSFALFLSLSHLCLLLVCFLFLVLVLCRFNELNQ